jgi:serine/threonine-protein kinase
LHDEIASGGMASVHLGRLNGAIGFCRTVAIKRLHRQLAADPDFVHMFVDEARLVSRIRHSNVVPTLDVVACDDELFLVMEYVHGESLLRLMSAMRRGEMRVPERIVSAIVAGALHGLHAAHEARGELGQPLGIVHRDVSPSNILVGADGGARVLDFGLAKASSRLTHTPGGTLKGKVSYMPPESIRRGRVVDRRADVYSSGVVLWEALTCEALFDGPNDAVVLREVLAGHAPPPSSRVRDLTPALDAVCAKALHHDPDQRYASAYEMAVALQNAVTPAQPSEVGEWVAACAGEALARRASRVAAIEQGAEEQAVPTPWLSESALVTVSSASAVAAPKSRRRPLLLAGAAGAFALSAALVWLGATERHAPAQGLAEADLTPAPGARASSDASADANLTDGSTEGPVAAAPELAAANPAARASDPRPASAPGLRKGTPRSAVRPACDPPFVRDDAGAKRWKRECL